MISYVQYDEPWEAGLLDQDICTSLPAGWKEDLMMETGREKKRRVPVYILEFRTGSQVFRHMAVQEDLEEADDFMVTESEGGSGIGSEQKRKRGGKKRGRRYAYTIIFRQPEGAKARMMTTEEGIKAHKFLDPDKERPDICPVSFDDTVKEGKDREAEVSKFCKRLPIRTGKVGRPAVRKKSKLEM